MRLQKRRAVSTALLKPILSSIGSSDHVAVRRLVVVAVFALCFVSVSMAQFTASPILTNTLLAKASPDECFAGIGNPYPTMTNGNCPTGSVRKVNQAYVWGLTQVGTKLWFGTAPNVLCLVLGGFLGQTDPIQTPSYVCEFGQGYYATTHGLPAAIGDWRPPRAYVYNTSGTGSLTEVTPSDPRFTYTLGLRSAGSIGDTVFLAGPALSSDGGVNFFAFSSSSQEYRGSCHASAFSNIRQWAVINNVLYAGVGNPGSGGGVIRWNGTATAPFVANTTCGFDVVANLPGDVAFLTAYGPSSDRIAVSAWPNGGGAGVYLSPPMPIGGFTSGNAISPINTDWKTLWVPCDPDPSKCYEPDPAVASTYAGGAIAYWNGALYFGTMHVPGVSAQAEISAHPELNTQEQSATVVANTYRAISIWRIQSADTTPAVQLLYGESSLPKYVGGGTFQSTPTNYTPLYGSSGFGNAFNNYTWTAAVFQNRLFFGTMDWSYLASESGTSDQGQNQDIQSYWGADLWRFDAVNRAAVAENINGLGNYLNYGLRSMITSADGQNLFVGTANPMNLKAKGGWELRRLTLGRRSSQNGQ